MSETIAVQGFPVVDMPTKCRRCEGTTLTLSNHPVIESIRLCTCNSCGDTEAVYLRVPITREELIDELSDGMTRDELLSKLRSLQGSTDPEMSHSEADKLLLAYIGDEEIAEAFDAVPAWYA